MGLGEGVLEEETCFLLWRLLLLLLFLLLFLLVKKEGVLDLVDVGGLRLKVGRRGGKDFVVPGHQEQGLQGWQGSTSDT